MAAHTTYKIHSYIIKTYKIHHTCTVTNFYSASALLAMQSAVLARGILSVCLSVCLSFRHVPVLCPDE